MEFIVKSRNMKLDDSIKDYADKKIRQKVEKFLEKIIKIETEILLEKNPKINENNLVEITVYTGGSIIRSTDSGSDIFEAIDKASSKLERQVKRYRNKIIQKSRKQSSIKDLKIEEVEEPINRIVKTKTFAIKPIDPDEAVLEMELLGHDFFVFTNSETGNTAVVYRRKDGNYGLISPSQ